MNKRLIGLTGGICSGKSTVSSMMRDAGFTVIDFDVLAAEDRETPEVKNKLLQKFGTYERLELRKIVFSDKSRLRDINNLMEEPILNLAHEKTMRAVVDEKTKIIVHDCPLLLDFPDVFQHIMMDKIYVVHCPQKIRIQRLLQRPGMTLEIAENIIKSQLSDDDRLFRANQKKAHIIENFGDLETLRKEVHTLIEVIKNETFA